jgi:hypothetical protein
MFALAVAGRCAPQALHAPSRAAAIAALIPGPGCIDPPENPIDEWFFVPLLQAADLVAVMASPSVWTPSAELLLLKCCPRPKSSILTRPVGGLQASNSGAFSGAALEIRTPDLRIMRTMSGAFAQLAGAESQQIRCLHALVTLSREGFR